MVCLYDSVIWFIFWDNGVLHVRCRAIIWTIATKLSISPSGMNFYENLNKMDEKVWSKKQNKNVC